jgi:hypothetical protein
VLCNLFPGNFVFDPPYKKDSVILPYVVKTLQKKDGILTQLPLLFLVVKAPGDAPNVSKCGQSPHDLVRAHFIHLQFEVPIIYGVCAIGTRVWLYKCFTKSRRVRRLYFAPVSPGAEVEDGVEVLSDEGYNQLTKSVSIIAENSPACAFQPLFLPLGQPNFLQIM